jgi:hypothetical protein
MTCRSDSETDLPNSHDLRNQIFVEVMGLCRTPVRGQPASNDLGGDPRGGCGCRDIGSQQNWKTQPPRALATLPARSGTSGAPGRRETGLLSDSDPVAERVVADAQVSSDLSLICPSSGRDGRLRGMNSKAPSASNPCRTVEFAGVGPTEDGIATSSPASLPAPCFHRQARHSQRWPTQKPPRVQPEATAVVPTAWAAGIARRSRR